MSRVVGIVVLGFMFLMGLGILIPYVYKQRAARDRVSCVDHLRRIGMGLGITAPGPQRPDGDLLKEPEINLFPPGTVVASAEKVEDRLSWYAPLLPGLESEPFTGKPAPKVKKPQEMADLAQLIDLSKGWKEEKHARVIKTRVKYLICPANIPAVAEDPQAIQVTQYLGNAGIGDGTASLSLSKAGAKAGIFRYEEPTPLSAIKDGTSATCAVVETNLDLGPWLQAGPGTIRSLSEGQKQLIGIGKPFSGNHVKGGHFLFADGSVRFLSETITPTLLYAQMTIAGQETLFDTE